MATSSCLSLLASIMILIASARLPGSANQARLRLCTENTLSSVALCVLTQLRATTAPANGNSLA